MAFYAHSKLFILLFSIISISSFVYGMKGDEMCEANKTLSIYKNSSEVWDSIYKHVQQHWDRTSMKFDASTDSEIVNQYYAIHDWFNHLVSSRQVNDLNLIDSLCYMPDGGKQLVGDFVEKWKDVCPPHSYAVKEVNLDILKKFFDKDSFNESSKVFFKTVKEILLQGSVQENAGLGYKAIQELETCTPIALDLNQIMSETVSTYKYPCEEVICKQLHDIKMKIDLRSDYEQLFSKLQTLKIVPLFLYLLKKPIAFFVKNTLGICLSEKNRKILEKHIEMFVEVIASGVLIAVYAGICYGLWTASILVNPVAFAIFVKNFTSMVFCGFRLFNLKDLKSMSLKNSLIQIMFAVTIAVSPSFVPKDLVDGIENLDLIIPMGVSFVAQLHHNSVTNNLYCAGKKIKSFGSFLCGLLPFWKKAATN